MTPRYGPVGGRAELDKEFHNEQKNPVPCHCQRIATTRGQFQQNLPQGRTYQLLRLRLDPGAGLVPEISGNRLMISIRMLHKADNGQMVLTQQDGQYEMVLCA